MLTNDDARAREAIGDTIASHNGATDRGDLAGVAACEDGEWLIRRRRISTDGFAPTSLLRPESDRARIHEGDHP
jgi:hypothetical protein